MGTGKSRVTIGGENGAHIGGSGPGTLGPKGVRDAGRAVGKKYGVKEVIIIGGKRTTGANKGKTPIPIRIPVK